MNAQHTPGPWEADCKLGQVYGALESHPVASGKGFVASVGFPLGKKSGNDRAYSERQEANLRLIAAAPELLKALERAKRVLEDIGSHALGATRDEIIERIHMGHDGILRDIGSAISKAKGQA